MTQSPARPDRSPYSDHPQSGQYPAPSQVRLRAKAGEQTEAELASALRAVRDAPESGSAWDALEELCEALQTPEPVAEAYLRMLTPTRTEAVREMLGQRAVAFCDSWFGDDPNAMKRVLDHVIETSPEASWAFDQLVAVLTSQEQWQTLLSAYDRALAGRLAPARRRQLLDDAAHVAKDFTDKPERAIEYLRELLRLDPSAPALCASLERVLSERKAWQPLIGLWQAQLDAAPDTQVGDLRVRIARVYLDHLQAPADALREAAGVLDRRPGDDQACALLERVLAWPEADVSVRLSSLKLLRLHHDSADRPHATIAALERALTFAPETEQKEIRRELAARLMARSEDTAAMAHYAELLRVTPNDSDARAQLTRLSERSADHAAHETALVRAADGATNDAEAAELLIAAMHLDVDRLHAREQAITLGQRVLTLKDAKPAQRREALETLERLLRGTERTREQLTVLEQLSSMEESPYRKRILLSEIAERACALGQQERALSAWQAWLLHDGRDLEALTASVTLAKALERHDVEVAQLQKRADVAPTPRQRREDLKRVAHLKATALGDIEGAIDTWLLVREEAGDEPDLLTALDELMSASGRYRELARIFETATDRERAQSLSRLCRLGDVHRLELEDYGAAARAYARALELAPECVAARAGMKALLGIASCAREVTDALSQAYVAIGDFQLRIDLLDARVAATTDPALQAQHMLEVAQLCEQDAGDAARALTLVAKALPRMPGNLHAQRELLRLAEKTSHLREAASALHWAALAASSDRQLAADLSALEAGLCERLEDHKRAAEAYEQVISVRPWARQEAHALVRSAALSGSYGLACETALHSCAVRGVLEPVVLEGLATAAALAKAYPSLCDAFAQALDKRKDLPAELRTRLELKLSTWYLTECHDPRGAEAAARRALDLRPGDKDCLNALAEVQRLAPTTALFQTLLALDAQCPDTLDPLVEAAQLLATLDVEEGEQRATLCRLYRRAADLLTQPDAKGDFEHWTLWALERLVPLELAAGQSARALGVLDQAVRLPIDEDTRAALRRQSARILEQQGQLSEALHVGLSALEHRPTDRELLSFLASLAARLDRVPEQLTLRKRELALCEEGDARLDLRLEIVRLTHVLEERDAQLKLLLANLEEHPGHDVSLEAACVLLTEKHRLPELCTLLSQQARAVSARGQDALSASLWQRAAELFEQKLGDREQAIGALEQVAALKDDVRIVDELVRLCRAEEDAKRTARWLSRRVKLANPNERSAVLLELAQAELLAGQRDDALGTLHTAFNEAPSDVAVRTLLTEELRASALDIELAEVLARAASATSDSAESARLAVQSARLYHKTLSHPEALVAVADLALGLQPDDAELCGIMADGLRALGRFEEARQVLMYLLEQYGRRRSPERAQVHVQLAEILRDEGDLEGSCAQLELALTMRSSDVAIMHTLAERAAEAQDLTRRERALRALLLCAKRGPVVLDDGRTLGVSELLLELSELAFTRGDAEQASNLRESALEALRFGDPECERIKQTLRERGTPEVLEQIVRQELAHAVSGQERAVAMAALADLLEAREGAREEALDLRLAAVELDPADPRLHDAAERSCSPDHLPRFRALLERLRERARRPSDAYARCEVCLRLASLLMAEGNLDRTHTLLSEAESTRVRESDVWRAQLRVAVARQDVALQAELLAKLDTLGGAELESEERIDVLYRLAEVRLADENTRSEGLARMRDALAEAARPVRAARILLRVLSEEPKEQELLSLFADVARNASASQLLQVAELCAEEGHAAALGTLIEHSDTRGASHELHAALLVKRARLLLAHDARDTAVELLLHEALSLDADTKEAETLLLAYYEERSEWDRIVDYLSQRFEKACDAKAADAAAEYALSLHLRAEDSRREDAVMTLRRALALAPERTDLRDALLTRLTAENHAHERAEVLEQTIESGDFADMAELSLEAATLYETCGDTVAAVRVLRLAQEKHSGHAGILRMLTEIFRRQDDAQALSELLAESARSEPEAETRTAMLREAAMLRRTRFDDVDAAIALLQDAVQILPSDVDLRRELALDLLSVGRSDEAIEALADAASCSTEDDERAALLHLRGKALLLHGQRFNALIDLQEAFSLAADSVRMDVLSTLEDARQSALDTRDADAERELTLGLASLRRSLGELREAAHLLETLRGHGEPSDAELQLLAELYAELSQPEDLARTLCAHLIRVEGALRGEIAQRLEQLIPQLDDVTEVCTALTRAHADQPDAHDIEDLLMLALAATSDDLSIARLLVGRAQRLHDSEARSQCMARAVQHFLAAGAASEATEMLQELHNACPTDAETAMALVDAWFSQARYDEARTLLDGLLASQPEGHSVSRSRLLLRLSQVARAQGDRETSLSAMQAARDADTSNRALIAQLAVLAEELEAWAVAENALTSVLLLKGPEVMPRGEALLRRARVAIHHSGEKRALLWAKKALEADPESEAAAQLILELEGKLS